MTSIFIDSSFFKAIVDNNDVFNNQALKIYRKLIEEKALLTTTNFILDETFTVIRVKVSLERAIGFRETLIEMRNVLKVIRVLAADEAAAWQWFIKDWSKLSYTDCISFAVMKRLAIDRVAAFDQHFLQAGFKIVN